MAEKTTIITSPKVEEIGLCEPVDVVHEDATAAAVAVAAVAVETGSTPSDIPYIRFPRDTAIHHDALELSKQVGPLDTTEKVCAFMSPLLAHEDQEVFIVLCLNLRAELKTRPYEIARGQRSTTAVGVEDVMRPVLASGCEGFIVVHNHPSGDPRASPADRELTKQIQQAAEPYGKGLTFLDHVVIGTGACYSIREGKRYEFKGERAKAKENPARGGYLVAYLGAGARRSYLEGDFTLEQASSHVRGLKRRGMTAWVESIDGRFVPIPGATRQPAFNVQEAAPNPTPGGEPVWFTTAQAERLGDEYTQGWYYHEEPVGWVGPFRTKAEASADQKRFRENPAIRENPATVTPIHAGRREQEWPDEIPPLAFAVVKYRSDTIPLFLGMEGDELVGLTVPEGEEFTIDPEDVVALVSADPGAVYWGVEAHWAAAEMRRAAEAPPKRVAKRVARGHLFDPTTLPQSGFTAVRSTLEKHRAMVPSVDTIRLSSLFAVSTIRNSIQQAERSFNCFVDLYEKKERQLPAIPAIKACFRGLQNTQSRRFAEVSEYAPVIQDGIKKGLKDRELRKHLLRETELPDGLGAAKTSFTLALLGHDTVCLDARILVRMYGTREKATEVEGGWGKTGRHLSELALKRYEAVEDSFLSGNPFYDASDPHGRARAQWMSWESAGPPVTPGGHVRPASTHSVWSSVLR